MRILEIGAGVGGATAAVLPLLSPEKTEYLYTDVSSFFIKEGKKRFAEHPFVRYKTLNVDHDLASQGIEPGSFDVILAMNVLHAARNIPATLRNLSASLDSGGILALIERTQNTRFQTVSIGLLEDTTHLEDDRRDSGLPLLSCDGWIRSLSATGYRDMETLPAEGSPVGELGQHFIVARSVPKADVRSVREHLNGKLPAYMVPPVMIALDRLPLTANGKINRRALMQMETSQETSDFVAPRNEMEERIAKMWSELLDLPRVGATDNFFEAGGDSLLANQFVTRFRKEFDFDLSLRNFMDASTVEKLSKYAELAGWLESAPSREKGRVELEI